MTPGRRAAAAVLVVAAGAVLAGCAATDRAPSSSDAGIGAWPTFLPSPSPSSIAHGDAASPALSYAGSPVIVTTRGGRMRVDVQGPASPADTPLDAPEVDCTFTVTLSGASRPIPVSADMFDVYDNSGRTHALTPEDPLPGTLEPGASQTVRLHGVLPAGEGMLRLRPDAATFLAAWDYVVEDD